MSMGTAQEWAHRVNQHSRDLSEEQLEVRKKASDELRQRLDSLAGDFLKMVNKDRKSFLYDRSDLNVFSIWSFVSLCKGREGSSILEKLCMETIEGWVKEKYGNKGFDMMREILSCQGKRGSFFR